MRFLKWIMCLVLLTVFSFPVIDLCVEVPFTTKSPLYFKSILDADASSRMRRALYMKRRRRVGGGTCSGQPEISHDGSSTTGWTMDFGAGTFSSTGSVLQYTYNATGSFSIVYTGDTVSGQDQWVKLDMVDEFDVRWGPQVRYDPAGDDYYLIAKTYSTDAWQLKVYDNDTWRQDFSIGTLAVDAGNTLGVYISGADPSIVVKLWLDPVGTCPEDWGAANVTSGSIDITDNAYIATGTSVGFGGRVSNDTGQWDNFDAGAGTY